MRIPLVLIVLLLAGCSEAPAPDPAALPAEAPVETLRTHAVEDSILSPVSVCPPGGYCAGVFGSDTARFDGHTWVAFDVEVVPGDDFVLDQVLGPNSQVRIVAFCLGERLTCPQEPVASAEGDFPLHLVGSGFRIADPDSLAFRVEYLGPLPVEGSGASYRLTGTLVSAGLPEDETHEDDD